jgi:hypothetical protein
VNDRANSRFNIEILVLFQICSAKLNAVFTPCYCVASTPIRNFQTMFTHPMSKAIKAGSNIAEGTRSNFSNEHTYEDLNSHVLDFKADISTPIRDKLQ